MVATVISLVLLYSLTVSVDGTPFVQSAAVRGKLVCGHIPLLDARIKLIDLDPEDVDDVLDETMTDDFGTFIVTGITFEETIVEPAIKIYHDCGHQVGKLIEASDDHKLKRAYKRGKQCYRRVQWSIPTDYTSNGTVPEGKIFDIGTINMAMTFGTEELRCY